MIAFLNERANQEALAEVVRFGKVGAIGFLVDGGVLVFLFHVMQWGHYESRGVSFVLAVAITWYMNRTYTFKHYINKNKYKEYVMYFSVQVVGSILNLCIYIGLIKTISIMSLYPILPLSVGAGIAMFFNYYISKVYVFSVKSQRYISHE